MKRTLFLLAIAATMLISCSKEEEQGTKMSVIDITVTESQWVQDDNSYSVWIDLPQITQKVFECGNVQLMFLEMIDDKECYFPLPAVYNNILEVENDDNIAYNVFYDFDWTVGGIYIYMTSDNIDINPTLEEFSFHIVITQ